MDLFSFIGLFLGLFGGTYTAISAFKAYFGEEMTARFKEIPTELNFAETHKDVSSTQWEEAQEGARKSNIWYWVWNVANAAPIAVFMVLTFWMGFYCLGRWPEDADKTVSAPSSAKTWLLFLLVIFAGAAVVSTISLILFKSNRKKLAKAYSTFVDFKANDSVSADDDPGDVTPE